MFRPLKICQVLYPLSLSFKDKDLFQGHKDLFQGLFREAIVFRDIINPYNYLLKNDNFPIETNND